MRSKRMLLSDISNGGKTMIRGIRDISGYDHEKYMQVAIEEAKIAGERGDKPIGAVLVHDHKIIGKMSNTWNTRMSKVHHAENNLIMEHAQYLREYGPECLIYDSGMPDVHWYDSYSDMKCGYLLRTSISDQEFIMYNSEDRFQLYSGIKKRNVKIYSTSMAMNGEKSPFAE